VDAQFWLIQIFNGVSYGALLFLLASGLTLMFGVMRIVNLAHGSYFLLGGYVALSVIWGTGSWALSIPAAALAVALIGLAMERVFLRPLGYEWQQATGARLSNFKNELRGCGPFLHDDPRDRPAAVFGGRTTLHLGPGRDNYVLIPAIPRP
jgi:hypothetical protein